MPSRNIRIIATYGPSFSEKECWVKAFQEGATDFRLNSSHLSLEKIQNLFQEYYEESPCNWIIDLQGGKLRTRQKNSLSLEIGDTVFFSFYDKNQGIYFPHPEILGLICENEDFLADDGRLGFSVIKILKEGFWAKVTKTGILMPGKGINFINQREIQSLSPKDLEILEAFKNYNKVGFAYSFTMSSKPLSQIRKIHPTARIIAKIEHPDSIGNMDEICSVAEEVWFCRGDMGAQAGPLKLGILQDQFIRRIPQGIVGILAGQVLYHMKDHEQPTASEIVHVYNMIRQGFSGFVLSDETAVGMYPLKTIKKLAEISVIKE